MKLLAIVITYYPETETARNNIVQYLPYVDKLIIWENTPIKDLDLYHLSFPTEYADKIIYKGTGKNEGIAYPLNEVIQYAKNNNYTHLLTMDQDSLWKNFSYYKSLIIKYKKDYLIFSPNINKQIKSSKELEYVDFSITSGTVYNIQLFSEIGLFKINYFIDSIDNEICYRAKRNKGYETICFVDAILYQQFGNLITKFGISSSNYSAFRSYYIVRNHLWFWKEYKKNIKFKRKIFILEEFIIKRIIKIILIEKKKKEKLLAIFRGIRDGLKKEE